MSLVAHVAGVPVEELIPTAMSFGTALLLTRGWVRDRLPRRRGPGR